jgi:glucan phosphoethanolaminetransferase (alkaline phosphatase superfamily)
MNISYSKISKFEFIIPVFLILITNIFIFSVKPPEINFDFTSYILSIFLSFLIWSWIYIAELLAVGLWSLLISIIKILSFSLLVSINILIYLEFGQFISASMIAFIARDPIYLKSFTLLFLQEYIYLPFVFSAPLIIFIFIRSKTHNKISLFKIFLLISFLFIIILNPIIHRTENFLLTPDIASIKAIFNYDAKKPNFNYGLYQGERFKVDGKIEKNESSPNIFVLINESLGRTNINIDQFNLNKNQLPFLSRLIDSEKNQWFLFENSLSSSTATDVSIPSLITGICPTKSSKNLHSAPLLWDWLKSINVNYYKIFSSPVDFRWANLESFLNLDQFDDYIRASDLPGPLVNDLGKDEYYSALHFTHSIKNAPPNRPILGIYFSNALHSPFQEYSKFHNHEKLSDNRYYVAMGIVDSALNMIINSIKENNRFDNSIIFIIGDHGDAYQKSEKGHRLYSFREEYWSAFMAIFISDKLQSKYLDKIEILNLNKQRLVGLIDIIPSLLDLLVNLKVPLEIAQQLDGYSLFQKIPEDRILIGLNTNETRSWQQEGFGIAQGKQRLIFDSLHGFSFFDLESDPHQKNNILNLINDEQESFYIQQINKYSELNRIISTHTKK